MPTQVMQDRKAGEAWLEYHGPDSSAPEQQDLTTLPFTIGRNESADLTVDSGRVSREHAVISLERGQYSVRDLNSTNGTFLNGQRIEQATLSHGDVLAVADIEFSFCCSAGDERNSTVTQVMSSDHDTHVEGDDDQSVDAVCEVRRLHERLMRCAVEVRYLPIAGLVDEAVMGYQVCDPEGPGASRFIMRAECRLPSRVRALRRLAAVEQAADADPGRRLFVPLGASDVDGPAAAQTLERLAEILGDAHRLVVQIPDSAACDIAFFRDFLARLRDRDMGVAYDGFASGASQISRHREIAPDYLKLSPSLVRNASRDRNLRRNLRELVRAAEGIGAEVVATGVDGSEAVSICREQGCRFAQGTFIGDAVAALPGKDSPSRH
jgi:EAL domain-containing protein (putative c-di-GMP-specific phosphodiesterase class I)